MQQFTTSSPQFHLLIHQKKKNQFPTKSSNPKQNPKEYGHAKEHSQILPYDIARKHHKKSYTYFKFVAKSPKSRLKFQNHRQISLKPQTREDFSRARLLQAQPFTRSTDPKLELLAGGRGTEGGGQEP